MKIDHFLWASLIPTPWVLRIATLFGAGKFKYGPGTIGSLLGILWYVTVFTSASGFIHLVILMITLYLAAGVCGEAAVRMGVKDPGSVILDEFVVIPICFMGLDDVIMHGNAWLVLLSGFAVFRFFDITKPFFIGQLDKIEGGWGILLDDVGAAVVTCVCLHAIFTFGLIDRIVAMWN